MKMDMKSLMKQAQELQSEMAKKQKEIAALTFEASAGGGMVTATVTGAHELIKLTIEPSIVSKEDVEMLQDLIVAAVGEAFKKANEAIAESMSGMMGGLGNVGGLFGA